MTHEYYQETTVARFWQNHSRVWPQPNIEPPVLFAHLGWTINFDPTELLLRNMFCCHRPRLPGSKTQSCKISATAGHHRKSNSDRHCGRPLKPLKTKRVTVITRLTFSNSAQSATLNCRSTIMLDFATTITPFTEHFCT